MRRPNQPWTPQSAMGYLAAMIDGEGTATLKDVGPRAEWQRQVSIANQDPEIIDATTQCCDLLGIRFTLSQRVTNGFSDKPLWVLYIHGRENYEKLRRLPIRGKKRLTILRLCNSYLKERLVA